MTFEDIEIAQTPLVLATADDVNALTARLWLTFPAGYSEYVTRFGEGCLGGSLVRIYPPWRIEKELGEWRRRINKYWFWDEGEKLLPKERALECVIIGDTTTGDELVFHPSRPNALFVLPRDSEQVFEVGHDLQSAIEWMCNSGELVEPFKERKFEPFDSRLEGAGRETDAASADPEGESLSDIVEMVERWVKWHAVRKTSRKELRQRMQRDGTSELLYEGVLIDGRSKLDVGYGVAWRMIGKDGKMLGTFRWGKGEGHEGSEFEPAKNG